MSRISLWNTPPVTDPNSNYNISFLDMRSFIISVGQNVWMRCWDLRLGGAADLHSVSGGDGESTCLNCCTTAGLAS